MSDEGSTAGVQKMRANRKVIDTKCIACRRDFQFGDEVFGCALCGGYHHATCWEAGKVCPHTTGQTETVAAAGTGAAEAFTSSASPVGAAAAPARALATPSAAAPPAWADESLIEGIRQGNLHKSTEKLLATYKKRSSWYGDDYFEAIRRILVERGVDDPSVRLPEAEQQPATTVTAPVPGACAEDEQYCPSCGQIVKSAALRCRFCNVALDQRLAGAEVPSYIISEISKNAGQALTYGIVGLFICAPIFGSMAIGRGNAAIRDLDQYPLYQGPRGKAQAGLVLGWIAWCLFIVAIFAQIASVSSSVR